ncbi:MAG: hypothetical protein ACRETC_00625 [Gammaproteobacteria bacterium]
MALLLTVFLVILIWTVDKFVRPEHAAALLSHFYALKGSGVAAVYIPWLMLGACLLSEYATLTVDGRRAIAKHV